MEVLDHPPLMNDVVGVDFDGTIVPWGPLMDVRDPFPGVPEAMQALKAAGMRIVILTSRLSPSWLAEATLAGADALGDPYPPETFTVERQTAFIEEILQASGVPYDAITAEKIPASVYFDDKAIEVNGYYPLNEAITDWLEEQAS